MPPRTIITLIFLLHPVTLIAADNNLPSAESLLIGERIYTKGILPSGKPVLAVVQGDIKISGDQITCVSCHQRSGMGSSESRQQILPITKDALFNRVAVGRSKTNVQHLNKQLKKPRPVYTNEKLKRAILEGLDPEGKPLRPIMPKFILDDENLGHLINYIKSLSSEYSPGVTKLKIHFATIITEEVNKVKQEAMLNTLKEFTKVKNANTRNETGRARNSPFHKEPHYTAYRDWELHTWLLKGKPNTWQQQLEQYYKKNPVFAIINGISTKSWAPIHQFCNNFKIPCLFPNTDLPTVNDDDFYTMYFSKGVFLEGEALSHYLNQSENKTSSIIQIFDNSIKSTSAATNFKKLIKENKNIKITDLKIDNADSLSTDNLKSLIKQEKASTIVLWLNTPPMKKIETVLKDTSELTHIFLSASFIENNFDIIPQTLIEKVYLTYPFNKPNRLHHIRLTNWARIRKLKITDLRVQANAYFAAKVASDALMHIRTNLYRDYFLERIEHMIDNSVITSVYPRMSLGPGQRFASKGSYIIQLSEKVVKNNSKMNNNLKINPVSDWIIP